MHEASLSYVIASWDLDGLVAAEDMPEDITPRQDERLMTSSPPRAWEDHNQTNRRCAQKVIRELSILCHGLMETHMTWWGIVYHAHRYIK